MPVDLLLLDDLTALRVPPSTDYGLIISDAMAVAPKYPLSIAARPKILMKFGTHFVAHVLASMGSPRVSRRGREVNVEMKSGRICVRIAELASNFEGPVHATGSSGV